MSERPNTCPLVTNYLHYHFANNAVANAKIINTDVLIIGAGLAGLSTALSLPKLLNITQYYSILLC